jgi:hypothetical protein
MSKKLKILFSIIIGITGVGLLFFVGVALVVLSQASQLINADFLSISSTVIDFALLCVACIPIFSLLVKKFIDMDDSSRHLTSRSNVRVDKQLTKRDHYREICSLSMSAYNLLRGGDGFFRNQVINQGINLEIIITDPNTGVFDDFVEYKVAWDLEPENKQKALKRTPEMLKRCVEELREVTGFVSPMGQYYALMIMYKNNRIIKGNSYEVQADDDDYMKIDFYSYFDTGFSDNDRRSIQLKRGDQREFFKFFEDEYARVRRKSKEIREYLASNESSDKT